jgi:acetyl-CoA synthetase
MDFKHDETQNKIYFSFSGRLTTEISAQYQTEVTKIINQFFKDGLKVEFDLGQVEYASSSFLRVCFAVAKKLKRNDLSIINLNQFLNDLLILSGLERLAKIEMLNEKIKLYEPSNDFKENAHINNFKEYKRRYDDSINNPVEFWRKTAIENIVWMRPFNDVLKWNLPDAEWFSDGTLNVSSNLLDKHLNTSISNKAAIIWEGEPASPSKPGEERILTYRQLHYEVCRFANVLKRNKIVKGDRVIIYMPMLPESIIAMLACARIGAIHSVVFGGFSPQSLAERVKDCGARMIITSDGGYRRGTLIQMKKNVDESIKIKNENNELLCSSIEKVIVLRRAFNDIHIVEGRDVFWDHELEYVSNECPPEAIESEHPLFILYTSGSTGKPKGIFHSSAGYLLGSKLTHKYIFDIKDTDIFWCTADIGWITGHSYVVYGPLANGTTIFMYEGAPDFPEPDRFWKLIDKYGITIFYTALTAIRAFMKMGATWPEKYSLKSLRLLGSVGEPINPEAWQWFFEVIGKKKCPIVDTWWQTETGSIMISPLPGAVGLKPGSATVPFFGIDIQIVDDKGEQVSGSNLGNLIIKSPWPSMLRGIWNDKERFKEVYWSDVPNAYFTGDGARKDEDGYFWIMGRLDDVINISGHRIGTAEVESALVSHHAVAEAAAVSRPDDLKGSALVIFVTIKTGIKPTSELREELRDHVGKEIGAVAKPDEIRFAEALPKTRSGKIMRRLLKQIAAGTELKGDMSTLEDFSVLERLGDEEN